ncbi:MAG: phosphatidate cytidylyltransferase [Rhodobacteraceae bacterium]|nr:phosphatidate cytidylyltransferase [Paracoccaceae bacterium]
MAPAPGRFADLGPRVLSGLALAAIGFLALWLGGVAFLVLVALVVGLMTWEIARLTLPGDARAGRDAILGVAAAAAVALAQVLPGGIALAAALVPALAGLALARGGAGLFALVAALVVLAGLALLRLRAGPGLVWTLWLVLLVIATDVLGYFAGRALAGPKLWPRVSPKKTWSGTLAGWAGAAAVGLGFATATGAGAGLVLVSVAAAIAAQAGDIAESAIKRRAGVKDASHLIPGHGGLADRFDGLFGAALFVLVAERLLALPPAAAAG